jgi:hypothetical protein
MTAEQLAEVADELNPYDPFDGDEEDEGSYVPCPECDKRMQLRFALEAGVICPLLEVAAIAIELLQAGKAVSIRQVILKAARAASAHCPVRRAMLPETPCANVDLLETAEALVRDQLRESDYPRGPPKAAA